MSLSLNGQVIFEQILNNLALLYKSQGNYAEAERLFQRALDIRKRALDAFHPDLATSFHNLGELYRVQERYQEAEPLLRCALEINEKVSRFNQDSGKNRT